jgi:hypothetical protein
MRLSFIFVFLFLSLNSAYARTQDHFIVSLNAGTGIPMAIGWDRYVKSGNNVIHFQTPDHWGPGLQVGAGFGYILDKHERYTVSASIDFTTFNQSLSELGIQRVDMAMDLLGVFTDFKMRLRQRSTVMIPYIKGSVGLLRASMSDNLRRISWTQNKMGFGIGAGIDFPMTDQAGFFVEAQYQIGLTSDKTSKNLPLKVGLTVK